MRQDKKRFVTLFIPHSLKLKIEIMATLRGLSVQEIIRTSLITFLQIDGYCDLARLLQNFPASQKIRVTFLIDPDLYPRLENHSQVRRTTKTAVILSALAMFCYLNGIHPLTDPRENLRLALRGLYKENP